MLPLRQERELEQKDRFRRLVAEVEKRLRFEVDLIR